MKSIKEKAKEWCSEHSNKGCTEQCNGCWQLNSVWGCEQHNMELAYEAGAEYAIAKAAEWLKDFCNEHYIMSYADSSEIVTEELIDIFKKKMEE